MKLSEFSDSFDTLLNSYSTKAEFGDQSSRYDITLDEANNPRQAFPDVYVPDGYVDMLSTKFIVENDLMHGDHMIGYVVPGGVDIDALKDVEYLEFYIKGHGNEILDELKKNYQPL